MVSKVTENKKVVGAGGGGGGEVEPDTLFTNTIGKGIFIFSEGPVGGLTTGDSKSVYLNDVPLMDSAGGISHKGVSWTWRDGLPDQTYIDGFPSAVAFQNVGVEVLLASPYAVTIANGADNYDAAYVVVACPALQTRTDSGNLRKGHLNFCIEVKSSGGSWVTVHTVDLRAKSSAQWEGTYRVELPVGGSPWEVRVRRLNEDSMDSPDGNGVLRQNETHFARYATITDGKFTYRNTALMGIEFDAKEYGDQIPVVKARMKGIKVWVPKNYDPVSRTYATTGLGTSGGIWDGTFKAEWTNNPVWIYHDLLVNNRYGLGQDFNPLDNPETAFVDKWALYSLAQYADEMVDDGFGTTEPRFTINTQITNKEEAYNLLQNIIAGMNGMIYFSAEQVVAVADRPQTVSDAFTQADVEQGFFEYSGTAFKTRHSVCIVNFEDPNNLYKNSNVIYEDPDYIAEIGYRVTEVNAFGCTSRAQAMRLAKWTLRTERTQTQSITFQTGHRGGLLSPGNVIKIFDDYKTGQRTGGRILDSEIIAGPKTQFTLDQNVTVTTGDKLVYVDQTGVLNEFAFAQTYTDTDTVAVSGTQELPIIGATYGIVYASLEGQLFRVMAVEESSDDGKYIVHALKHDANKYAYVDSGLILPEIPTSVLTSDAISPITVTDVVQFYEEVSGTQAVPKVMLSWEKPVFAAWYSIASKVGQLDDRVVSFELQFLTPLDGYRTVYKGTQTSWTSEALEYDADDEYGARVRAIDNIGRVSVWTPFTPFSVLGKDTAPLPPTNLVVTPILNGLALSWDNITDLDFKHVEIYVNTVDNESTATLVSLVSDDFYIMDGIVDDDTRYFYLKTVTHNVTNNVSLTSATGSGVRKRLEYEDFGLDIDPVGIVTSLPSPIGYTGPQVVLLTTDNKLYRYTGSAWTTVVETVDLIGQVTTAQIEDAAINTAKFAAGITPVEIVATLPVTGNFVGRQVFLTTDNKLYRYDGVSFTATVPTVDLTGTITTAQIANAAINTAKFAASIQPITLVTSVPGTKSTETVFNTVDGKLYRWNGSSYITTVPTTDLTGTITTAQIANAALTTAKFASSIEPITLVTSVPGSKSTETVFNTTNGKLYRWSGSAYVATVPTTDLTGTIADAQIAALAASKITGTLTNSQIADLAAAKLTGQLTTTQISDNAITTGKILAGAITTAKIAADAVTANEIAALTITASQIASNAITSAKVAAGAITAGKIAANSVTAAEIAANTITAAQIAANTITAGQIAAGAITASELAAGAVIAGKIAAGVITATEIAAATITGANIAGNTITAANIAAYTITAVEIAANAITAGHISAGAVNTSELAASAVTAAKIAAGTITSNEIAAGTITAIEIAASTITGAKIAAGTITATNIAANTITAGQIAAGSISTTELAAGAVTAAKIAAGTITATEIASLTITGVKIAANTITAANIAANTITSNELAANSVIAGKIAAGSISTTELAAGAVTAAKISVTDLSAISANLGTITVGTANITDLNVTTIKIANNAATSFQSQYSPSGYAGAGIRDISYSTLTGSSTTLIDVFTVTVSGSGSVTVQWAGVIQWVRNSGVHVDIWLYRDTVQMAKQTHNGNANNMTSTVVIGGDVTLTAGSHTFYVYGRSDVSGAGSYPYLDVGAQFLVWEGKK